MCSTDIRCSPITNLEIDFGKLTDQINKTQQLYIKLQMHYHSKTKRKRLATAQRRELNLQGRYLSSLTAQGTIQSRNSGSHIVFIPKVGKKPNDISKAYSIDQSAFFLVFVKNNGKTYGLTHKRDCCRIRTIPLNQPF